MPSAPRRGRALNGRAPAGLLGLGLVGAVACADLAGIQTIDPAVDGHGGAFCASTPRPTATGALFLCDDFDEGSLPSPWSLEFQTSGALTVSDAQTVSPPGALDLAVDPLAAQQPVNVSLRTVVDVPPLPSTLSFAFSLEPVRIDPSAGAAIVLAAIDFLDASQNRYTVQLAFDVQNGAATTVLDELYSDGRAYVPHAIANPLPLGAFTAVTMRVDWTAAETATASVLLGGATVLSVPLAMNVQAAQLQLSVGTTYATEPSPGWEVRFDNVLFTAL